MKQCPQCSRVYSDTTLNFCLEDGTWLTEEAVEDSPKTAVFPEATEMDAATLRQVTVTKPTEVLNTDAPEGLLRDKTRLTKRSALVAVALLILILGTLGAWMYRSSGTRTTKSGISLQSAKISRLTASGKVVAATISPDGKYVAYVADDGGQQSIWLRQTATSSNIQLVPPIESGYSGLTFSPDGNYVYYSVFENDSTGALFQIPVLGGAARKLLTGIRSAPAFSPDGRQIAFLRSRGLEDDLLIANGDGSGERVLHSRGGDTQLFRGNLSTISWSPDGKTIACFLRNVPENYMTVIAVAVESGEATVFTAKRWFEAKQVAWLADGASILVAAQDTASSEFNIWQVSYPAGEVQRITNDLESYRTVSLTADNTTLATVQAERTSKIWVMPANDSAHATQITHDQTFYNRLGWTPDGRLIFNSNASGNFDLYSVDPDGRNVKQLTTDSGWNGDPTVSADGRTIIFMSDRSGPPHIWRMDIDGGNQKQITTDSFNVRPQLSPDGQWIVYATSAKQGWYIWKMPAGGGDPVQLTDVLSDYPVFSPDGKQIACYYWETPNAPTRIAILSVEGGRPLKLLTPTLPSGRETNLEWTADGRSIVYGVTKNGVANLWAHPVDGGEPKQITNFTAERILWFDLSPDGKRLATTRGTLTSDVLLIRDFK